MRYLVTGGAGFIGTNLIKRLLEEGHSVVSIDNYSTGKKENHQEGCTYWEYDLSSGTNPILGRDEYDVIFHLAALPRIQPSFDDPISTFNSNVLSTLTILERVRRNKTPVVYAGSSSIHGDVYSNPYTHTKWQGEQLCKMYNQIYNLPIAIGRFYNVYGPYELTDGSYCTLIGIFKNQYHNKQPLTITGDGEQRRDFTHVDDIVDGLMRVGNRLSLFKGGHIAGEEFEFGRGKNYSVNEIADAFGDYPREYIPKRDGEMRETLCTDRKSKKELDWKPEKDILDYVKGIV